MNQGVRGTPCRLQAQHPAQHPAAFEPSTAHQDPRDHPKDGLVRRVIRVFRASSARLMQTPVHTYTPPSFPSFVEHVY
jgi:hypothetical protein